MSTTTKSQNQALITADTAGCRRSPMVCLKQAVCVASGNNGGLLLFWERAVPVVSKKGAPAAIYNGDRYLQPVQTTPLGVLHVMQQVQRCLQTLLLRFLQQKRSSAIDDPPIM